jgi:signal transduction histidine kinase
MRRLSVQIYLTVVGTLLLLGFLTSLAWWLIPSARSDARPFEAVGTVLGEVLPGSERSTEELEAALQRLGRKLSAELTVRSADGELLAAFGEPLPAPSPRRSRSGFSPARGGPTAAFRLPDGRWLMARYPRGPGSHLGILAILAAAIALGAYPVVRRLTGRLERLQQRVDALGAGDFSARVEVEGKDEVASLARSFNQAAERIEGLVRAQRGVLASASHELRSPLARLRVAIELLGGEERPELRSRIAKDISELDELIGELLLMSRLDAVPELTHSEEVDLLALVAEEASRSEATVSGEPVRIVGDPRLLRRALRNLLENGRRYAAGSAVEVSVERLGEKGARVVVADRGPGVPEPERERIFEPFYRSPGLASAGEGVGLGLALVRQIARHHRGEARCREREGGGTRFELTLCDE